MSLRVEYHELVDLDLSNAWHWYEDQEDGLGDRFLGALHATVVRASRWPNAGEPVLRDDHDEIIERKVPADGFPYAVRYRILGATSESSVGGWLMGIGLAWVISHQVPPSEPVVSGP